MNHVLRRGVHALFLVFALAVAGSVQGQLPPERSTVYSSAFTSRVQFPARNYAPGPAMTVEAWVYREDAARCETIVSHDFTRSFWFGFCGNSLRFYRAGGTYADAGRNVAARRWTHVAASHSGGQVRFYIDGALVATQALTAPADTATGALYLGSDPAVTGYRFLGALDEVRLWSVARSDAEVRDNRYREITSGEGLAAVFPQGGRSELVSGATATLPTGVRAQRLGILPRDLVVPRTTRNLIANGSPTLEEFEGAEQMVVRYRDGTREVDGAAQLILGKATGSSTTNLWMGLVFPELESSFALNGGSVRLYFDRNASGDAGPATNDFRLAYAAYSDPATKTGARGNGSTWAIDSALNINGFTGSMNFCAGEFAPPCVEMLVHPTLVAETAGYPPIRFMMDLHRPSKIGVTQLLFPAPFDANPNSPATWPMMRFGDFVEAPSATFSVRVFTRERNADGSETPLPGVRVTYRDDRNLSVLASATSNHDGSATAWLSIARNVPLRVDIEGPAGWTYTGSRLGGGFGLEPTQLTDRMARFPGCATSNCSYRDTVFTLGRAPGAVSFGAPTPGNYSPEIVVRESPDRKTIPETSVTLRGTNLHNRMSVWAFDRGTLLVPTGSASEPPGPPTTAQQHYFPLPIEGVAPDGSTLTVRMSMPQRSTVDFWVRDNWDRPERERYWHWAGSVTRAQPPYELLHGFEFENRGDGHDIDDYRAAFPDLVCDPFKMVGFWAWFPIYLLSLDGGGECVGMVSTSDQFSRFRRAETFDPLIHYANGFQAGTLMPARFHTGNPCSPTPQNVWAQIRANHGVQMSAEFIGETLAQLRWDLGIYTVMADQYARLRANPRGQMICFRPTIFDTGHAVLALETRDAGTNPDGTPNPEVRDVIVHDPNHPQSRRVLRLNVARNTFFYDGFDPAWSGRVVLLHEVRNFWEERPRNLITLDSLGAAIDRVGARGVAELIAMLVSGDARGMATLGPGARIGREADGTLVETAQDAVSIPVWGYLPGGKLPPSQMFMRQTGQTISLEVHVEGKNYAVNTMHLGNMLQLFVEGGRPGEVDMVRFDEEAGAVRHMNFTAQSGRTKVLPRLALAKGGSNYVASLSWEGIALGAGKGIGVRALRDGSGGAIVNDSGVVIETKVVALTPSAEGIRTNEFGPLALPLGAVRTDILANAEGTMLRSGVDLNRDGRIDYELVGKSGPTSNVAPMLGAQQDAQGLWLSWEIASGMWVLEHTESLSGKPSWQSVGGSPALNGNTATMLAPTAQRSGFYRLRAR